MDDCDDDDVRGAWHNQAIRRDNGGLDRMRTKKIGRA